ncbi:hypothetical protein BDR22DRAFT_823780 [Usnea florida]
MPFNKNLLTGTILLSLVSVIVAAPSHSNVATSSLVKRSNTFVGCSDDQRTKAGQALADAANLALIAFDQASTSDPGFSHYFQATALGVFKNAMSTIAENNEPTNPSYQFIINCDPTGPVLKTCGKKSYAVADSTVPANDNDLKTIWLCPLFWKPGPDSAQNLPDTNDEDALNKWCAGTDYTKFVTAGHTILHEMTHLDAVAKLFPLDPNNEGQHGTEDYDNGSSYIQAARKLAVFIANGRTDVPIAIENADSYAGAATGKLSNVWYSWLELWAEKFCNKAFIPPQTGY